MPKQFHDICLADSRLAEKALSLGYTSAQAPSFFKLSGQADLRELASSRGLACASSASSELLRKALLHSRGSLLLDAFSVPRFERDEGLVRSAAHSASEGRKLAFVIPHACLLRNTFVYRARFVAGAKTFLKKCLKLRAPFVLASGASNEFELKSPREAISLGELLGLSFEQASSALSVFPERLLQE